MEACRKLNEVIGLKGMSRYGKWDPGPPPDALPAVWPQGPAGGGSPGTRCVMPTLLCLGISNRLSSQPAQMELLGPRKTTRMTSWGASIYPSG